MAQGITKLSFMSADFEDGEMRPDIPLNAVDRHVGNRMRERRTYLRVTEEHMAERIGFDALRATASALRVTERYFYRGFGRRRDVAVGI